MGKKETPKPLRDALDLLESAGSSLRCKDLVRALQDLGFDVRDGKKQGHKVFTHPHIDTFTSGSFSCGHGKNQEVKPNYPKSVLRLLRQYEAELISYLRS